MSHRSTRTHGHGTVNGPLAWFRASENVTTAVALEQFDTVERHNEIAAAARRHPSWNPARAADPRFLPDPEWTTEQIRFARLVLLRKLRVFGPDATALTRLRADGRREVADHSAAAHLYCDRDDWCILENDHPGDCNDDREVWFGPDTLYPAPTLVTV